MKSPITAPLTLRRGPGGRTLSLEEVAARCRLHPLLVERFVALGLIAPIEGESGQFAPEGALRLQRALRLRHDFGLSYSGAALALELLDRIEALERRLELYERKAAFESMGR